jgi:hypothetical protein
MRSLVYGASPISEAVLTGSIALFGCDFMQAYGLTETTGGVVQLDPHDHDPGGDRAHLLRAAGKPWGDVELRIVDPESLADLPDGDVGEVWVRSKQVMKGYWKNPGATAAAIVDGWFRTGDAGYLIDGYLYIHDRVKDMVLSGGENIYPAEVENALMKHPDVADVAVIGVPHEKWGETVKAVVVRTDSDARRARSARVREAAPRLVQVPDLDRLGGYVASEPFGQGAQDRAPRPVLGGSVPPRQLTCRPDVAGSAVEEVHGVHAVGACLAPQPIGTVGVPHQLRGVGEVVETVRSAGERRHGRAGERLAHSSSRSMSTISWPATDSSAARSDAAVTPAGTSNTASASNSIPPAIGASRVAVTSCSMLTP